MKKYTEGYELKENEYMLKLAPPKYNGYLGGDDPSVGFITKYNKDGSVPVSFTKWNSDYHTKEELDIFIHTEDYRRGWKIHDWRFGMSQNWTKLIHPDGFILEVRMERKFLKIIKTHTIKNGEIDGSFKWEDRELIER
jgi:hypothetical protein